MAQKTKVKELVGRGLHSYHTKALQQIDRIEKKNKEQNHKISILSNELDNDYLTKTEEGSVVSLEHSKEGMVYLDELQGNTLVNYCTDGSKEMTLNGDIDVEGTFVTTTEGVDSGKIDVMCEGNTLVNVCSIGKESFVANGNWVVKTPSYKTMVCKPSTLYTFVLYDIENTLNSNGSVQFGATSGDITYTYFTSSKTYVASDLKGIVKFTLTSRDDISDTKYSTRNQLMPSCTEGSLSYNLMILEGDWTNKEVPSEFFIGMKSVGQDDENGHKIEILSQSSYPNLIKKSKNLSGNRTGSDSSNNNGVQYLREDNVEFARVSANKQDFSNFYWWLQTVEPRKKGETYTISYDYRCVSDWGGYWYPSESYSGSFFPSTNGEWRRMKITRTITSGDAKDDMLFGVHIIGTEIGDYIDIKNVKMEKGTNNSKWIPSVMDEEFLLAEYSNKKEISLNEPLRSVPSGVKDKFVKISGKWFVERNCGEKIFNGDISEQWSAFSQSVNVDVQGFSINVTPKALGKDAQYKQPSTLCDKFKVAHAHENTEHCYFYANEQSIFALVINKTKASDVETLRTWLQNNNVKVVYVLASPIYEEITDVELITYLDTTHISNNSIIPCNMKIKNSGYNAIIKPNTLYTVAVDTNKSGTVGMNLGGAKVTTANNVAKITTPATLTDDSLRLYGKGIKGSKVRLLEGDKTNWIPSHFEGMKSSFEDKTQSDGTYKMEILSKLGGLNLCTNSDDIRGTTSSGIILEKVNDKGFENVVKLSGNLTENWFRVSTLLATSLSPNTTITISALARTDKPNNKSRLYFYLGSYQGDYLPFNEPLTNEYKWVSQTRKFKTNSFNPHFGLREFNGHNVYISKMKIEFGDRMTEWCPSIKDTSWSEYENYNKIQFSSIKPLRSVGTAKDKLVFINNEFKIERNVGSYTINGTESWYYALDPAYANHNNIYFRTRNLVNDKKTLGAVRNDKLPNYINDILWSIDKMGFGTNDQYFVNGFCIRLPRRIVGNGTRAEMETNCKEWLSNNNLNVVYELAEPTYEEIPFELQKIILEGYENGTLFLDTNIPPTATVTYAGETPIVKATKLNKTEVSSNTDDINDNIIPYLMDMDYRVVCLQLATEEIEGGVSMARLFGGTYEMIKRDILSKRLTREEYGYRLADYFNAGKLTEEQVRELEELR